MTSLGMVPQDLNYQQQYEMMMPKQYPQHYYFQDQRGPMKNVLDTGTQYMDMFGNDPQQQMQEMKQEYCRCVFLTNI